MVRGGEKRPPYAMDDGRPSYTASKGVGLSRGGDYETARARRGGASGKNVERDEEEKRRAEHGGVGIGNLGGLTVTSEATKLIDS